MKEVSLKLSWDELFDKSMLFEVRKARWEKWKKLCFENGNNDILDWWTSIEEPCYNCIHCDYDWCNLSHLPCNVNPITTFKTNMLGMACMGAGFKPIKHMQLNLFEEF